MIHRPQRKNAKHLFCIEKFGSDRVNRAVTTAGHNDLCISEGGTFGKFIYFVAALGERDISNSTVAAKQTVQTLFERAIRSSTGAGVDDHLNLHGRYRNGKASQRSNGP